MEALLESLSKEFLQVKFPDSDMHRDHFKSDWHRYNLKRKVFSNEIVVIFDWQSPSGGRSADSVGGCV